MKAKKGKNHQKLIKKLQTQVNDLTNKWKRALADYRNLEKRIEEERNDFVKFANASLLDKLLFVLDDLERAEKHIKDKGLTMAVSQFKHVLKSEGVEEIKAKGAVFDPERMDCVEMVKGVENKVADVVLKGYLYHGRVLRPAKVKVGKGG